MKSKKIFNQNKVVLTVLCLFMIQYQFYAQAPTVEWRNYTWINHEYKSATPIDQRHSDYDWWYDHCTGYTNPVTKTGAICYIGAGTSNYRCTERSNPSATPLTYDETNSSYGAYADGCIVDVHPLQTGAVGYDYGNWENPVSGNLGMEFNSIGRVSLNGQTDFLFTMNHDGEYYRVKQLNDGNFITVGHCSATRKKTEAPQNGTPLYYNPTLSHPNDYFKRAEIFLGDIPTTGFNAGHWDVMKFDINGNCIFNNIYGYYDFNGSSSTFNAPNPSNNGTTVSKTYSAKQIAYSFSGESFDVVQDVNNNIAIVGDNPIYTELLTNPYDANALGYSVKPIVIKMDVNGNVLDKKILAQGFLGVNKWGSARAITTGNIGGTDCYIVASQITDWNTSSQQISDVLIEAFPINNFLAPNVWSKLIHNPIVPVSPTDQLNRNSSIWGIAFKNNKIHLPLLSNCNQCHNAGDNKADLYFMVLDATNGNQISNVFLSAVHAFDLKARITELSNGDFAVVSARKTSSWQTTCPSSTPPSYILGYSCTNIDDCTPFWNTDTYVARVSSSTGLKVWDKSFDSDTPYDCNDYPTSTTSGGGDPKRQECMYGVSEAPDGGIVLSGNCSANVDDSYMAKLYSDCNSQQTYDIVGPYDILSTSPSSVKNWNTSHKVIGVVRVKAGATLTISGASTIIEFADYRQTGIDTRIVVEAGGKLVVTNGALLTSVQACTGSFWSGIEVQGDINYRQYVVGGYDVNHGIAILNTGATIQNAHYALNNFASISSGIDWAKLGGGIIQCNGANFINCQKGANFFPYTNFVMAGTTKIILADRSSFINCTFKTDATLNPATGFNPEVGISMWQTKGVTIRGNTFINNTPNNYQIPNRGSGIISYDASFNCNITPNNFTNLFYGIDASSALPSISLMVDGNIFTNNHRGIALHGMHYTKTNNNTFTIGEPYDFLIPPCGIYLDGCDAYQVQGNTMSNAIGTTNNNDYGIVAHLTGLNPNELRQNNFSNIAYGIQAQNKNSGLQLKCNKFTTGTIGVADINVQSLAGFSNGSIAPNQGACSSFPTTLPGNEFSQTCGVAKDLDAYFPFYNTTVYNTRTSVTLETPPTGCYNGSYFVNGCTGVASGLVCPPIPCCLNAQQLRLAIKTSKQDVKSLEQLLATGDAQLLYNILATGNETQIKNKLLNRSPYLSDAVLLAFINHNPQLTDATIKEVLLANAPLTQAIYNAAVSSPISSATKDAIKIAQLGVSQRSYTEQNLAYEKSQLQINYNNLLSYVLNDLGNEARFDSLLKNMDMVINPKSRAVLASAFIEQKQFAQAQVQIDSLQSIDPAMSNYLQTVMQLQQTVNQLQAYSGSLKTQIDALRMQDSSTLAVKANALYNALFNTKFNERIYVNNSSSTSNAKIAHNNATVLEADNSISVYPNPANELIYFKLNTETTNNISIELYSISGQLVASKICDDNKQIQEIETTHLQSGMYFYRILQNSILIKTNKIVIIK